MKISYLFRYGSPESYQLIPQEGVSLAVPQGYKGFNCCWDAVLSPDGFYFHLAVKQEW